MSEAVKTLEAWEKEKGFVVKGKPDLTKQFSETEMNDYIEKNMKNIVGVNHKQRTDFLLSRGHEVNRKNLIDTDL